MTTITAAADTRLDDALGALSDAGYLVVRRAVWQMPGGRYRDGSADILIVDPDGFLLVLATGHDDLDDRLARARRSKFALLAALEPLLPAGERAVGYAALLAPGERYNPGWRHGGNRLIVLDPSEDSVTAWLRRAAAYWRVAPRAVDGAAVRRALAVLLGAEAARQVARPLRPLLAALAGQRRALVTLPVAADVTALATARARQLARLGWRVLLTSADRGQAQAARDALGAVAGVDVAEFALLCFARAQRAGLLPLPAGDRETFYARLLPTALRESVDRLGAPYDAVLVLGSDGFSAESWSALLALLRDPADGVLTVLQPVGQPLTLPADLLRSLARLTVAAPPAAPTAARRYRRRRLLPAAWPTARPALP